MSRIICHMSYTIYIYIYIYIYYFIPVPGAVDLGGGPEQSPQRRSTF